MNYVRTVDELTELSQTTFETNAALSLQLVETGRPALRLNDDRLVSSLQPGAKISATNLRVGFGDINDDRKALQLLGFDGDRILEKDEPFAPFEGDVPESLQDNPFVRHTITHLLTLVPFPMKTACSARLYIDGILIAAAKLAKGFEMSVEEMCESPLVQGPLDHMFYDKMICVCVAEGENDCILMRFRKVFSLGLRFRKFFAQLSAVRYNRRKRKGDEGPES